MGLFGNTRKRRFTQVVTLAAGALKPALIEAKDELGEEKFEKILMDVMVLGYISGFVRAIVKVRKAEGVVYAAAATCGEVLGGEVGSQIATRMEEITAGGGSAFDSFTKSSKRGERDGEKYLGKELSYTGYELKGLMRMVGLVDGLKRVENKRITK